MYAIALLIMAGCSTSRMRPVTPPGRQPDADMKAPAPKPEGTQAQPASPHQPPQGEQVFYLREGRLFSGSTNQPPVPLTDGSQRDTGFQVSLDGEWLSLRRSQGPRSDWLVSADGKVVRQLPYENPDVIWRSKPVEMLILHRESLSACRLLALAPGADTTPRDLGQFSCASPAISNDGKYAVVLSASDGETLQVITLDQPVEVTTLPLQIAPTLGHFVQWLSGNRLLLETRTSLAVADSKGRVIGSISGAIEGGMLFQGASIDPAARWAVARFGLGDKTLGRAVYDLTTFERLRYLAIPDGHSAYGWSPDGRYFLTQVLSSGQITVWDSTTWAPVDTGNLLQGLRGDASWSAEGHKLLLRRESDKTVVIVDLDARTAKVIEGSAGAQFPAWR